MLYCLSVYGVYLKCDLGLLAASFNSSQTVCSVCDSKLSCPNCASDECPHCKLPTVCLQCKQRRKPPPGVVVIPGAHITSTASQYDDRDVGGGDADEDSTSMELTAENMRSLIRDLRVAVRTANEYKDKIEVLRDENDRYFEHCQVLQETGAKADTQLQELKQSTVISIATAESDKGRCISEAKLSCATLVTMCVSRVHDRSQRLIQRRVVAKWIAFCDRQKRRRNVSLRATRVLSLVIHRHLRRCMSTVLEYESIPQLVRVSFGSYECYSESRSLEGKAVQTDIPPSDTLTMCVSEFIKCETAEDKRDEFTETIAVMPSLSIERVADVAIDPVVVVLRDSPRGFTDSQFLEVDDMRRIMTESFEVVRRQKVLIKYMNEEISRLRARSRSYGRRIRSLPRLGLIKLLRLWPL